MRAIKPIRKGSAFLLLAAILLAACGAPSPEATDPEPTPESEGIPEATPEPTPAPTPAGVTGSGLCANPYFPVVAGASWTYTSSGDGVESYSFTDQVTDVQTDGFTLLAQFTDLTRTQRWTCGPDGLVAIDYSGGAAASVSTAGVTSNYQTTDVTGLTLPATINPGDTWSQTFFIEGETDLGGGTVGTAVGEATSTFQAVGFEEVSVPAGSFEALRVDVQISLDLSVTMADLSVPVLFTSTGSTWYAAGVGWVKSEASAVVADTPFNELLELTSYSIP